jgi:hypothetical protein
MSHVLPAEVSLIVLSHLPIPSLLSLAVLSRQWVHFFVAHQSEIFRRAALYHEYITPGTLSLEDALSMNAGKPCVGSASWKDFCKSLLFHFHRTVYLHSPHKRHFPAYRRSKRLQVISILQKLGGKRTCCCTRVIASRFQPPLHQGRRKGRDMYLDPHLGRYRRNSPLFWHCLVVSSPGA